MTELSFVIPCYNEVGNAEAVYRAIHRVFDEKQIDIEIVMVNDGSKDGTEEILNAIYRDHPDDKLTIVHFSRNFGKEAAILAGLKHTDGRYVCLIDADLQHNPKVALDMYEQLKAHPECDCAAAYQETRNEGKVLDFCKKKFYSLINFMTGLPFRNGASDFRVFTRKMADAILSIKEYDRFTKGIFSFVGFETIFIPYVAEARNSGTTKWSFFKLLRYALQGIISYTTLPLLLGLFVGGTLAAVSFIALLVLLIIAICGVSISPVLTISAIVVFIGSLNMIMLGIIGAYLSGLYKQNKGRPIYIEKNVSERK